jgi:NAD(P)-dependent dehydrogenase (short-subunit alcohol dehydrogenase family)
VATTAIVTGGTRGIGRAIAAALLAEGGRVMVCGRDPDGVAAAVRELEEKAPGRVAGHAADVRDRGAVDALMDAAARRFGGFDALVNNAGVGRFVKVESMTDDDWDAVVGTNLTGAYLCSRAALPHLRRNGGGWIVSIASLSATAPFAGGAAYCASKAALAAFSEALMQEVRAENIRVSVVLPGSVATDFSRSRGADAAAADWKLSPDDVAHAVVDLLRYPARSLPSRIEIRPTRPKSKG